MNKLKSVHELINEFEDALYDKLFRDYRPPERWRDIHLRYETALRELKDALLLGRNAIKIVEDNFMHKELGNGY